VGQKNGQVYQWAPKGTRPRQMADQRYESAYIFGAVCPARDKGAALVDCPTPTLRPCRSTLRRLAHPSPWAPRALSSWTERVGTSPVHWTSRKTSRSWSCRPYSPELNPTENVWQFLRQAYLSNRVFETWEAIVDACCEAWNRLTAETGRIQVNR